MGDFRSNQPLAHVCQAQAAHDSIAITVRPEGATDADAIDAVTQAAFAQAPHSQQTEHHIVRALRTAGALAVSLVAVAADGAVVGHVAASPVTLAGGAEGWFGIGPLSVAPAWQRQGVGARLMHNALQALRDQGAAGAVLLGDPAYYARFGFAPQPGLVLPGVPAEYFQALVFKGNVPQSAVRYHAAFEATGAAA